MAPVRRGLNPARGGEHGARARSVDRRFGELRPRPWCGEIPNPVVSAAGFLGVGLAAGDHDGRTHPDRGNDLYRDADRGCSALDRQHPWPARREPRRGGSAATATGRCDRARRVRERCRQPRRQHRIGAAHVLGSACLQWQPRLSLGQRVPRRRVQESGLPMSRTSERTSRAAQVAVKLPGFTLAALRTGGETNPPVLLVPGWTGSKEDFGPILEPLGEAGYLVTAVDLRGQFRSPFRPDGDYSPIALGNDLQLAAAALGGGVHLLGHSFGGLVARAAVLADPDQFRSLVLLDSGPAGIDDGRRERLDLMRPVLAQHGLAAVYQAL